MLDLEAAEQAFTESCAAVRGERDVIIVDGGGAAEYLHGQLSQDVQSLAVGQSRWTLLLQPQGKIDARLRLTRVADERYWLDVEAGFGQRALERLERFKLRVDADISLETLAMVSIRGPRSSRPDGHDGHDGPTAVDALWPGVAGVDLLGAEVPIPDDVPEAPPEALEALRIRLGIAAMGSELDENTIPAAAGVVEAAVDFEKGCYVGQELVARIDSRGNNTPTRLHGLRIDGDGFDPAWVGPGADPRWAIEVDGADVGRVTSVALSPAQGAIALGYVKRAVEAPAEVVVLAGPNRTSVAAEVVELPLG